MAITFPIALLFQHFCSVIFLWYILLNNVLAESDLSFVISQQGVDKLGNFTVTKSLELLQKNSPIDIQVNTAESPGLPALGHVFLRNFLQVHDVKLLLENNNTVGFLLRDLRLNSRATFTPRLWVLPMEKEVVALEFGLPQSYLSIDASDSKSATAYKRFRLKNCSVPTPEIKTSAKSYWVVGAVAKLGATYLRRNFASILCSEIENYLRVIDESFSGSISLASLTNSGLPDTFRTIALRYDLADLTVLEKHLTAKVAVSWQNLTENNSPHTDVFAAESEKTANHLEFELRELDSHHLTVWIDPDIANQLLEMMSWDFVWMRDLVPINSTKIPGPSRRFLATLCHDCYFRLNAWNDGPPVLSERNGSLSFERWDKIKLWVVNPSTNRSSIFVSFRSLFDGQVDPFSENSHLKARVDLLNVRVVMNDSAFPPEWDFFVNDLVQGVILNMVWPGVKETIEKYTLNLGVPLPSTCGFDPDTFEIQLSGGKIGLGANLRLHDINLETCASELAKGVAVSS